MTDRTTSLRPRAARDSFALTTGTAVNGLFAYIFFALVTRGLGADGAAPIAVLWTYWGACTAMVTFPVQHWIIRAIRAARETDVADGLPRLVMMVLMLGVVISAGSWLVRTPLFTRSDPTFPLLMAIITIGALFTGIVRGGLAARGRFLATAIALAADNVSRVCLALFVLWLGGGPVALGFVLGAGALVGFAWPSAYRFQSAGHRRRAWPDKAFLGAIASGSLIAQLVLVGGPAVLALLGGPPSAVTVLFATMALFRAPFLIGLGLANQITGALTHWVLEDRTDLMRRYRMTVVVGTIVWAALAAGFGALVGHAVVGAVFGADTTPPRAVAAIVAAASVLAVGNLLLSLIVVAKGAGARLARAWLLAAPVMAVVLMLSPGQIIAVVSWAFLAGEVTAFLMLILQDATHALPDTGRATGASRIRSTS